MATTNGQVVSELFARVALGGGVKAAVDKHKKDELKVGFAELPEFSSGVAKLTRFEFYADEGVLSLRAVGAIDAPAYGTGGVPLKGMETVQFRQLTEVNRENDTKQIIDLMRQLLGDEKFEALLRSCVNAEYGYDLVRAAESIQAATIANPIYFRCSNKFEENKTGKTDKNGKPYPGRCWQRWQLVIPGYTPMSAANVTLPKPPSTNGSSPKPAPAQTANPDPWTERAKPVNTSGTVAVANDDVFSLNDGDSPDWDVIAAQADSDSTSCTLLYDAAAKLGYTEDDCVLAESYAQVAGWLKAGVKKGSAGASSGSLTTTVVTPKVGQTAKYYPLDPKKGDNVRLKRGVQCEVFSVDEVNKSMALRSLADQSRSWSGISWDDPNVEFAKSK